MSDKTFEGACGIKATVLADSLAEGTTNQLTTFEIEVPRIVWSEFMTHRMFCLAGDTELSFDLPTAQRGGTTKIHKMKIKDFVSKWHNGAKSHTSPRFKPINTDVILKDVVYSAKDATNLLGVSVSNIRSACRKGKVRVVNPSKSRIDDFLILGKDIKEWYARESTRSFSIKNKLKSMSIRQLNEDTMMIQHSTVTDCCFSGAKEVFKVSAGKYSITGSKDHKVLTAEGWKTIEDIKVGVDYIIAQKLGNFEEDKADPLRLKKIDDEWTATFNRRIKPEILSRQDGKCTHCGDKLEGVWDIHHCVPVSEELSGAFDSKNVVGVHQICHKELHAKQGWQGGTYLHGAPVLVTNVESKGVVDTYDLSIAGEFANFLGNGVVVHNCRNAASSRAIPFAKMQEQLTGRPVRFGAANKGMQDTGEDFNGLVEFLQPNDGYESYTRKVTPDIAWEEAKYRAIEMSKAFMEAGYHKQVYNRICEPFQMIKGIVSATEFDNWFWLRDDKAADPTIAELARVMLEAKNASTPQVLKAGEWHLPYVTQDFLDLNNGKGLTQHFYLTEDYSLCNDISLEDAIKVSAARCAAVSFRNNDYGLEKCLEVYERLVGDERKHSSALEHPAQVMQPYGEDAGDELVNDSEKPCTWQHGISHADRDGNLWSGNFKGFVQHRKTIAGENYVKQ